MKIKVQSDNTAIRNPEITLNLCSAMVVSIRSPGLGDVMKFCKRQCAHLRAVCYHVLLLHHGCKLHVGIFCLFVDLFSSTSVLTFHLKPNKDIELKH